MQLRFTRKTVRRTVSCLSSPRKPWLAYMPTHPPPEDEPPEAAGRGGLVVWMFHPSSAAPPHRAPRHKVKRKK